MHAEDDGRLKSFARACGQLLLSGGRKVVWCDSCKTSRMDGPEYCPACGGPLVMTPTKSDAGEDASQENTVGSNVTVVHVSKTSGSAVKRREPITLTHGGKTQTVSAWARALGLNPVTIYGCLKAGWNVERALSGRYGRTGSGSVTTKEPSEVRTVTLPPTESNKTYAAEMDAVVPGAIAIAEPEADPVFEKRLILADGASNFEASPEDAVPVEVQLLRDRCARLDEVEYEISILKDERRKIIDALKGARGK
jgi:hypothetical protein